MISAKMLGMLVAAFVAGSFIASPELRAYAANTVFSTDIVDGQVMTVDLANNAVTAAKIKDGEVKAAEIATDAVGAAELQGVTKLLFGECNPPTNVDTATISPGVGIYFDCAINGVDADDSAIATYRPGSSCFYVSSAKALNTSSDDKGVEILLTNGCMVSAQMGSDARLAVIVYDK